MPAALLAQVRGMMTERSPQPGGHSPQPSGHSPQTGQEPRTPREADGWQILSYLLGGMILYGGIGWLISHFTGISWVFPIGMIFGIGLSVAMIIFRFTRT